MKVLVTGANGMVGAAVKDVWKNHDLMLTDKNDLDVVDYNEFLKYKRHTFNLIIHLAAMTDLEECELNKERAYATNTAACANVVRFAYLQNMCPVIFVGTAGIFDGTKDGKYNIYDEPNPINVYGSSKWYGEQIIDRYLRRYILRSSWMMGGGKDIDKKFINKIYKKIMSGAKEIKVCDDVFGSPTYTVDLANSMKYLIDNDYGYGVYHTSGEGDLSRYQCACEIVDLLGLKDKVQIIPVKDIDVRQEFFCPRSKNEVLENSGLPTMRHWKETMKEYVDAYFKS